MLAGLAVQNLLFGSGDFGGLPVTVSATLNPVALSPPYNWIQFDAVHTGDRAFHQLFSSTAILHVAAVLLFIQK